MSWQHEVNVSLQGKSTPHRSTTQLKLRRCSMHCGSQNKMKGRHLLAMVVALSVLKLVVKTWLKFVAPWNIPARTPEKRELALS